MSDHQSELTIEEMVESLTGYEELAIAKHYNEDVSTLLAEKPTMGIRALVFVHQSRREGMKADAAKKASMDLTMKAVGSYFRDDSDEVPDPVDLETPTGKGELLST